MKRLLAALSFLVFLGFPSVLLAQSATGTAPAPVVATPRPTLTAVPIQPAAAAPIPDTIPNVINLPPVNTVITMASDPPVPLPSWVTALAGVIAGVIAVLGIQSGVKKAQAKNSKPCSCCNGTGRESTCDPCVNCNGTGIVDDQQDQAIPCMPCGESGEEPCGSCKGEFEREGASCFACARTGKNRDEEGEPVECLLCKGEGEVSVPVTQQVPCPKCQ